MPRETLERSVLRQMGKPKTVARELARFKKAAKALSSNHPRLIEEFPKQWIVVYDGKVRSRQRVCKKVRRLPSCRLLLTVGHLRI